MAPPENRKFRSSIVDELRSSIEIYVLLVCLAVWYIGAIDGAFAVDEAIYAETGYALFQGNPYLNPTHMFAPTVKYFIGFGQLAFGQTPLGTRLPIVVFALLSVYLTYLLGRDLQGRLTGILAAFVLGTTYFFATHSVMAMLDVPLAFFFISLTLLTTRWVRDGGRVRLVLIGAVSAAAVTTKAYGVFYVLPPLSVVALTLWRRSGSRRLLLESRYPIAGGAAVLTVIYLPYVFISHPPVPGQYGALTQGILQLPVIGNFAYVFGAAILRNVVHASGGHAIQVGSTVYQYPPAWSYLYWLYERGGAIYLGLFSLVSICSVYESVRWRDRESFLLGWFVFVPFVCLSLLTVKFPRYVLPLFPLVSVVGIYYASRLVRRASRSGPIGNSSARSNAAFGVLLGVVVLTAGLVPPSPLVSSATTPLDNDTGYDHVAESIRDYANGTPRDVVVLTYSGSIRIGLEYYLRDRNDLEFESFRLKNTVNATQCERYRQRLTTGQIDLVVADGGSPRLDRSCGAFDGFVRSHGERRTSVTQADSGTVALYRFGNTTARSASTAEENRHTVTTERRP